MRKRNWRWKWILLLSTLALALACERVIDHGTPEASSEAVLPDAEVVAGCAEGCVRSHAGVLGSKA